MRDYKDEYKKFQSSPQQKKDRAGRNAARKKLGLKKGDPRDAAHTRGKDGKIKIIAKHYSLNRGSKSDMPGDSRARGGFYKKIK